jgi:hypothetical protein
VAAAGMGSCRRQRRGGEDVEASDRKVEAELPCPFSPAVRRNGPCSRLEEIKLTTPN